MRKAMRVVFCNGAGCGYSRRSGDAWARSGEITSGLFLGYNEAQQGIYVSR